MKPFTIETNPYILDIIGTFDEETEYHEDEIAAWITKYNTTNATSYTIPTLPEQERERCLCEMFQDDSLIYEMYFDGMLEYLQELLDIAGFEDGDMLQCSANSTGWRNRSGSRIFTYDGTAEQFLRETCAKLDDNYTATITGITEKSVAMQVSCHDIPCGTGVVVEKGRICECCGEFFLPRSHNHRYCEVSCRKEMQATA